MSPRPDGLPESIAIAGAWGYIGRKFLDVALAHGLTTFVHDPGPMPADVDATRVIRIADKAEFHALRADLYHLALHPEHRRLDLLLGRNEPLLILDEKPMAGPGRSDECDRIVAAADASAATVLYDFPELYDPLTVRILDHLARFRDVRITELRVQRSKDREDPSNPRNFKRMVPIQYQESVHCLAFVLFVLASMKGGLSAALADGVRIAGESDLYHPPNPRAYATPVDGRCRYRATFGEVSVEGLTDFKRGALWAKRRVIRGLGDGRPFEVEVSYLEGAKSLRIDGIDQPCDPSANSYEQVLATLMRWSRRFDCSELMSGLFPNPRFARLTYRLSEALWRSCREGTEQSL
ncbi:MAG TPA: hypothetical protein VGH33_13785 [Isosphaeraceae bacterium]|jgi:predicted dehydrogenase